MKMSTNWKTILLRCQYYTKQPTDSMQSLSKSQWLFWGAEIEKSILKLTEDLKGPWTAKTNLKKKNEVVDLILSDFKIYYKATVIKAVCTRVKTDTQTNEIKQRPEINPRIYGQMIFQGANTFQWGKGQSFQQTVLGKLNIHMQKN